MPLIAFPKIVCLCGSTKFKEEFVRANMEETLSGNIVLSVGAYMHADNVLLEPQKRGLDILHLRKIDLANEVFFLNVRGYVGKSTARELAYACWLHKVLRWLDEEKGEEFMSANSHALGAMIAAFHGGQELPEFSEPLRQV